MKTRISGHYGGGLHIIMCVCDCDDNDLDHLYPSKCEGHHSIKIVPGQTYRVDVEVKGCMPDKPSTITYNDGSYEWTGMIKSICHGVPGKTSKPIEVNDTNTNTLLRLACAGIRKNNPWANNWQNVMPLRIPELEIEIN